jgi:hypothetical protein
MSTENSSSSTEDIPFTIVVPEYDKDYRNLFTPIQNNINVFSGGVKSSEGAIKIDNKDARLPSESENNLNEFADNHSLQFIHNDKWNDNSNASMNDLDNICIRSNSPFLFSNHNSNNNSDNEQDVLHENENTHFTPMLLDKIDHLYVNKKKYKKLTYEDALKSLSHYYDDCNKYSDEMDILITYIRGQKNLFSQSSNITYMKLYTMLISALCITAFVTIITPFIENQSWNVVLITACNAVATFIISMTRYLQLEFTGNAYSFLANNFEKFEHSLEIANNKILFMKDEKEQNKVVLEKIKELEFKIGEIKDIFQVIVPNEVKTLFPVISHINIFSLIKRMESHKTNLIIKFKDIKNEINYNIHKINQRYSRDVEDIEDIDNLHHKEKNRILFLNDLKNNIKNEIVNYKDAYNQLEYLFTKEIQFAETHVSMVYVINLYYLCWGRPKYLDAKKYSNPVIKDYLNIILCDD